MYGHVYKPFKPPVLSGSEMYVGQCMMCVCDRVYRYMSRNSSGHDHRTTQNFYGYHTIYRPDTYPRYHPLTITATTKSKEARAHACRQNRVRACVRACVHESVQTPWGSSSVLCLSEDIRAPKSSYSDPCCFPLNALTFLRRI